MEFDWPEDALALREEIRAFLGRELPSWWDISVNTLTAEAEASHHDFCRAFSAKLARHGYLTPHWPASGKSPDCLLDGGQQAGDDTKGRRST